MIFYQIGTINSLVKTKTVISYLFFVTKQHDNQGVPTTINFQWKEIVRIMNTQKAVTTTAQNNCEEVFIIRRCSDPNEKVQAIYRKLNYNWQPFTKRKFVVPKSEFRETVSLDYRHFSSG
jgi:hypothetical protein